MRTLDIYEIVAGLVGSIRPIGETNTDADRLENLKEVIELIEKLVADVGCVAEFKDRQEHSIQKAGKLAHEFLTEHFRTPYEGV